MNRKPKILIVDDDPENLQILMEILKDDYTVIAATNGAKALQLAHKPPVPEAVLLDVKMPVMDGYEVCTQLRANEETASIPVIFITALGEASDETKGFAVGGVDYIVKPFQPSTVKARLKSHLTIQHLNQELQQKNSALQAALQLRKDFSDTIVHDLRTPLTSILLACIILNQRGGLNQQQQEKIEQIRSCGERLDSLINSLLLLAKIEAGRLILHQEQVALESLARAAMKNVQAIADSRGIQLSQDFQKQGQEIWVDASLLQRVIENLLFNAIKFSPKNGQVDLVIDYPEPAIARIRVIDAGRGVSNELKEKIFSKYEIGETIKGAQQIGIGLAFCKMAVEAHNGRIYVEDNHPQGAKFTAEIQCCHES